MSMITPSAFRDIATGCDGLLQAWEDQGGGRDGHTPFLPHSQGPACRKLCVLGEDVQVCIRQIVYIAQEPGQTCRMGGEGSARSLAGPCPSHTRPLWHPGHTSAGSWARDTLETSDTSSG